MRKRAIAALAASAVALSLPLSSCAFMGKAWHSNCEVTAKDQIMEMRDGNSSRVKRVSTTCGSFNVEDAIEVGHFNSWDLWQKLEVGKIYDIQTGGARAGFLSMFPVVLQVTDTGKR